MVKDGDIRLCIGVQETVAIVAVALDLRRRLWHVDLPREQAQLPPGQTYESLPGGSLQWVLVMCGLEAGTYAILTCCPKVGHGWVQLHPWGI